MDDLVAHRALHKLLFKVLGVAGLIHLSTDGTGDRVGQPGLEDRGGLISDLIVTGPELTLP